MTMKTNYATKEETARWHACVLADRLNWKYIQNVDSERRQKATKGRKYEWGSKNMTETTDEKPENKETILKMEYKCWKRHMNNN